MLLVLIDIWACGWIFGLYGTMVRRPHQLDRHKAVFHYGMLQSVETAPDNIGDMHALGVKKRGTPSASASTDRPLTLGFGGSPYLEIQLKYPVEEHNLFLPRRRKTTSFSYQVTTPWGSLTSFVSCSLWIHKRRLHLIRHDIVRLMLLTK